MDVQPAHLNIDSFRDSFKGLVALEIILDLPFGFPINNIISLLWSNKSSTNQMAAARSMASIHGKLQCGDYLHARDRSKISKFRRDYVAKKIAFVPAILSVAGKIHLKFRCLLWVMTDIQMVEYFNLVGDDDDTRSERFKCSRAHS